MKDDIYTMYTSNKPVVIFFFLFQIFDYLRLVNSCPISSSFSFWLTTSNGKPSEDITNAPMGCLMYIILTTSKSGDGLSIGCDRSLRTVKQN